MNFSSIDFWIFLGGGLACVYVLRWLIRLFSCSDSNLPDRILLALLSLSLLGYESFLTLVIFMLVFLVTYFGLMYIRHMPSHFRRFFLGGLVALQFAPLLYYKYANFFVNDIVGADISYLNDLLIPVGISFYTFQMVGFVIDYYHAHTDYPKFIDTLNFSSFFLKLWRGQSNGKSGCCLKSRRFALHLISQI